MACTEWPQVRALVPDTFVQTMAYPIVIDGRSAFDPDEMIEAGSVTTRWDAGA